MKDKKYNELIAYASSFVSFILPRIEVDEIILFGSTARREAAKESDIDLFFNVKNEEDKIKKLIKQELGKFYKSNIHESWNFKGIKNEFNIEVGNLDQWKLKRSIVSDGIVLYGKYKTMPEKLRGFILFTLKPIKNIAKRNKIIRHLFGREEKNYKNEGAISILTGKKISASSFLLPLEKSKEIEQFLNKQKVDYNFFELWTDVF